VVCLTGRRPGLALNRPHPVPAEPPPVQSSARAPCPRSPAGFIALVALVLFAFRQRALLLARRLVWPDATDYAAAWAAVAAEPDAAATFDQAGAG
jgi:hypothetical protein